MPFILNDSAKLLLACVDRQVTGSPGLLYNLFMDKPVSDPWLPLASLQDALDLLVEQAEAYDRALPSSNYPARAAVSALLRLAKQAQGEARSLADGFTPVKPAAHPFSPREFEVLTLAAEGLTNKEIAYRLGISERTAQFHLNSIFNKTTTNSRTEAVALALRNGWIGKTG